MSEIESITTNGDDGVSARARRGFGRVYRRKWSRFWWIQHFSKGKIHRESSGSEHRSHAVRLLRKRYAELGAGQVPVSVAERTMFEDLVGLIRDDYKINGRRSLERVEYSLKHLRVAFGLAKAMDVTADRIARYIAERQEAEAKPATIVQEVACLRRMFPLAIRAGRVAHRPYIPTIRPSLPRAGFFEPAEYEALMRELPEYLEPLVEFLLRTGWRLREALTMKWCQVDFQAGMVRLEPGSTKNAEGREFPFSALPALEALLRRQREATTALERELGQIIPHVFHNRGRPLRDFRKAWRAACRRAHLIGRIPHDFRRTAVRNLERAGVPRSVAMKLTGHKTESVYRRYAIVAEADLREGVAKLATLHRGAAGENKIG